MAGGVPKSHTGDQGGVGSASYVALAESTGTVAMTKADGSDVISTTQGIVSMGMDHDTIRAIEVSRQGRTEIPNRRFLLVEPVEGSTLNTQRWTSTVTTMTITQAAVNGILMNASAITTINTGALLTSRVQHLRLVTMPLHFRSRIRSTLVANQEGMAGLFFQAALSATATITGVDSGVFWKWGVDGTIKPSHVLNGVEVTLGADVAGSLNSANYYDFHIVLDDDRATFQVFNSATGLLINRQTIKLAVTTQRAIAATHVYTFVRVRNSGSAPASAGQMFLNEIEVANLETLHGHPWGSQLSDLGLTASFLPTTYAQSQQFANSAAPTSATLSNTAAGYTTLGGIWQFANVVGTATDYCLFGFTIPTPYTFRCTGVHISAWNTGAANAATPATMLMWGLGLNGASANLSTGGHIRRLLGQTTIPISAAIGAAANDIDVPFPEGLSCYPGTNLAIILRVVGGAATASQVIQGMVDVRGTFE